MSDELILTLLGLRKSFLMKNLSRTRENEDVQLVPRTQLTVTFKIARLARETRKKAGLSTKLNAVFWD
ncbi:MAG: hypothetical protein LBP22_02255 [Deltaproteobacteria bacterium]|nr:hypothetical protein [Deltaproteobacteria bacterium]